MAGWIEANRFPWVLMGTHCDGDGKNSRGGVDGAHVLEAIESWISSRGVSHGR